MADAGEGSRSSEPTELDRVLLRWLTPGQATESRVVDVSASELATTASSLGAEGYVITSVLSGDPTYTLLAVRNVGGEVRFEAKVEQFSGSELNDAHIALGTDGYVVTAAVADDDGVTLVASRPTGDEARYDASLVQVGELGRLGEAALNLASDGYAVVSAFVLDGKQTLLATRIQGTTPALIPMSTSLEGLHGHFETDKVASFGCVGGAVLCDAAGCTSFCTNDIATSVSLAGAVSRMEPTELAGETARFGEAGFIPTALVRNGDHYVLLGIGKSLYELAPKPVQSTLTVNGDPVEAESVSCSTNHELGGFEAAAALALRGTLNLWMENVPWPGQVYEAVGDPTGISSIFFQTTAGNASNADDRDGTVLYTNDSGRDVFEFRNVTLQSETMTLEIAGHIACPY